MKTMALLFTAATLGLGGAMAVATTPAQAQVGVEIGPGGARIYENRPHHYGPVVERRRVERRVVVDDDSDCRVEVRRRINRFGERVVTRTRICD